MSKDFPSEDILFCIRDKNSSRLSGTLPMSELIQELSSYVLGDKLYAQVSLSDGSFALREVGSIGLEFFPAHTSPSSSLEEKIMHRFRGMSDSRSTIAVQELDVPPLPPLPTESPKEPPSASKKKAPTPTKAKTKKEPTGAKAAIQGQGKIVPPSPIAGAEVEQEVIPFQGTPQEARRRFSRFGRSGR